MLQRVGYKEQVRTAAVSTPVGPPPQITKLSKRLRSSGVVVGKLAVSKLSNDPRQNKMHEIREKAHTHYSPPDRLRITDSFELEAVLETGYAMCARGRTNSNDQFVVSKQWGQIKSFDA